MSRYSEIELIDRSYRYQYLAKILLRYSVEGEVSRRGDHYAFNFNSDQTSFDQIIMVSWTLKVTT